MDMKTIILLLIIAFAIFIAFAIKYYCKRNEKSALIPIILEIFITIFTLIVPLYSNEIKKLLPPFDNSTKIVTTTEPTTEPTTESPTRSTTTTTTTATTTESNNEFLKYYEKDRIFSGKFTSANQQTPLFIKLPINKTGYYTFEFKDISNVNNTYKITIVDNRGENIKEVYSDNDSFGVNLINKKEYYFYFTVTHFECDFSFEVKMYLPNN